MAKDLGPLGALGPEIGPLAAAPQQGRLGGGILARMELPVPEGESTDPVSDDGGAGGSWWAPPHWVPPNPEDTNPLDWAHGHWEGGGFIGDEKHTGFSGGPRRLPEPRGGGGGYPPSAPPPPPPVRFVFPPPGIWGDGKDSGTMPTSTEIVRIRAAFDALMKNPVLRELQDSYGLDVSRLLDCMLRAWKIASVQVIDPPKHPCEGGGPNLWADPTGNIGGVSRPVIWICRPLLSPRLDLGLLHELAHLCCGSELEAMLLTRLVAQDDPDLARLWSPRPGDWEENEEAIRLRWWVPYVRDGIAIPCVYEGEFFVWDCETGEVWLKDANNPGNEVSMDWRYPDPRGAECCD